MEIKIDQEFCSLIPAITDWELHGLEQSLLDEGCRDAFVLWTIFSSIAHNRYEICQKHDIKFKTIVKSFDDRDQAKIWIINNQLARRNLNSEQMSNLRGMIYNLEKKEDGVRGPEKLDQNEQAKSTAEKLSKEFGVSPATIRRDGKFAEALDKLSPEEKRWVLLGKSEKTKGEITGTEKKKDSLPKLPYKISENLYYLKSYWNKASKTDRKIFLRWIKNN